MCILRVIEIVGLVEREARAWFVSPVNERLLHEPKDDDTTKSHSRHDQVKLGLRQLVVKHDRPKQVAKDLATRVNGPEQAEIQTLSVIGSALAQILPLRDPDDAATKATNNARDNREHDDKSICLQEAWNRTPVSVLARRKVGAPAR